MRRTYVSGIRALRRVLEALRLLGLLDRWASRSRTGLWLRSLLSIYDLQDLLRFDVPWWTFEAADRVAGFLDTRPQARVFEWGSGASTVWLARRAGSVTAIEHDPRWAELVRPVLPANAVVRVVAPAPAVGNAEEELSGKRGFECLDFAGYVAALDDADGTFDLVVVDGRARNACFHRALSRLAPGGMLVFDNVERQRYRDTIASSSVGVDVEWTRGLTPALPYPTRTALVRLRD